VYLISDDKAIVQTADFFTPIVDDPALYGKIAATNALSDVYAMGARPLTALNILCYPENLGPDILHLILAGGQEVIAEAGAVLIGGHSVDDAELKYGLAVTGEVHPDKLVRNDTAKVGAVLILTKPLGTGVVCTALKQDKLTEDDAQDVFNSMATLNDKPVKLFDKFPPSAATDITGFGFLGHAMELASASKVGFEIDTNSMPMFKNSLKAIDAGCLTKGDIRNREYTEGWIGGEGSVSKEILHLLYDPQTSGGLLLSMPDNIADDFLKELHASGVTDAAPVGRVTKAVGTITLR